MGHVLRTDLVKYECSCGLYHPLNELYVCRTCVLLKCVVCAYQHVDGCFCRACFENVALTEARTHRNRCNACYECPVCEMVLTARSINDKHRLLCNNCKYTSLDAGYDDNDSQTWTKQEIVNENFFDELKSKMKELSLFEKIEIEKNDKRRRSNMLYVSDKYGLHSMLSRKRLEAVAAPLPLGDTAVRDADVEELSLEEIMKHVDPNAIPKYEQQLMCLENFNAQLYPNNLPLTSRRSLRCNVSDHGLVRSEYNPTAVNFRVKAFAYQYVPDIKMVRPTKLFLKADWPLFLYISNSTAVPVKIKVQPLNIEDDNTIVECHNDPVEYTIPAPNVVADINEQLEPPVRGNNNAPATATHSSVVFKKRHRIAVHLQVKPKSVQKHNYLLIDLDYQFEGNPFPVSEQPQVNQQNTRVKINLGPSKESITEEDLNITREELRHAKLSY
jgi:dynactin-4|uniref:Dynactin subunit 4 n=1 Tax=Panagrolaimus sp. PS1159 TaxID=55785 RepID=A0AC35GD51_9BILA